MHRSKFKNETYLISLRLCVLTNKIMNQRFLNSLLREFLLSKPIERSCLYNNLSSMKENKSV